MPVANTPAAPRRRARGPGRPVGGDAAVREALLDTARHLFLARGFGPVTIRQIAAAAGSSPATIHYHFGDKLGLYRAMLEVAIAPVVEALQRIGDPARADQVDVATVIRLYTRMLAANPWVPALIVQEVLAEGGRFREQFIENFAGRLAPLLAAIIRRGQERGVIRTDLDPRLAALSAISMTVEGDAVEHLAAHTIRVLFEGIRAVEDTP